MQIMEIYAGRLSTLHEEYGGGLKSNASDNHKELESFGALDMFFTCYGVIS